MPTPTLFGSQCGIRIELEASFPLVSPLPIESEAGSICIESRLIPALRPIQRGEEPQCTEFEGWIIRSLSFCIGLFCKLPPQIKPAAHGLATRVLIIG